MQRDLFERERLILMKRNYSKKITGISKGYCVQIIIDKVGLRILKK